MTGQQSTTDNTPRPGQEGDVVEIDIDRSGRITGWHVNTAARRGKGHSDGEKNNR